MSLQPFRLEANDTEEVLTEMATFTAVRNKKQTAGTTAGVMKYVVQGKKTMLGDRWMVTGHNCVAQSSYLEMVTTKRRFQKTDGRQFYHFVQSFSAKDDLTPPGGQRHRDRVRTEAVPGL